MKDGIHDTLVNSVEEAVNPDKQGTKARAHSALTVDTGRSKTLRLRSLDADAANVMRQALAGMLWSKQLHRARDGPAGLCRHGDKVRGGKP